MNLRARQHRIEFPRPAMVMGVLNVTPDSFSDGGRYRDVHEAIDRAQAMVSEGAELIDIGGESTRPQAEPVTEAEERKRVLPVIEQLASRLSVPLSIDTQKSGVARAALEAGASLVNDIAANRSEEKMWEVVAEFGAGYVAMHMQGTPQTMQQAPAYADIARELEDFFTDRMTRLAGCGVAVDQVILDVGIGFGKTLEHNLELLANLNRFTKKQRPLLLGVSRKSFIGKLLGAPVEERLSAGLACTCWGILSGVNIIRTHDVRSTLQAIRMTEAILSRTK